MELNTWTDAQYAIAALYRDYSMLALENARLQAALAGHRNNSIMEAALDAATKDMPEVELRRQVIYLSERLEIAERDGVDLRTRLRSIDPSFQPEARVAQTSASSRSAALDNEEKPRTLEIRSALPEAEAVNASA